MSYKIVVDSSCEIPAQYLENRLVEFVPLELEVNGEFIIDDENFNQAEFLKKVAMCPTCPKSSCPSPERYMKAYEADVDNVYVVTLSGKLSGSYNSAVLGKNLYEEKYGHKNIHIVDSCSASCGEAQIAILAMELEEQGLAYNEVVKRLDSFRDDMKTYFILDNLETLRKNGRLTGVKALVASTLNIKPVMGATQEGTIHQLGQAVGINKALKKMVEYIFKDNSDTASKRLMISHCNCLERAEYLKKLLLEKGRFLEVLIVDTAGLSSMYANDGGVILTI